MCTKGIKWLVLGFGLILVGGCGIIWDTEYAKEYIIRGDPFETDNTIACRDRNVRLTVAARRARHPVVDSFYNISMGVSPADVKRRGDTCFINRLTIDRLSIEFVGDDNGLRDLRPVKARYFPSRSSPRGRYLEFGRHMIPNSVDTIRIHLFYRYEDSTGVMAADTVVDMWKVEDHFTGAIIW